MSMHRKWLPMFSAGAAIALFAGTAFAPTPASAQAASAAAVYRRCTISRRSCHYVASTPQLSPEQAAASEFPSRLS